MGCESPVNVEDNVSVEDNANVSIEVNDEQNEEVITLRGSNRTHSKSKRKRTSKVWQLSELSQKNTTT